MIELDIAIEADWPQPPDWEALAVHAAAALARVAPELANPRLQASVLFADDAEVHALNAEWRGKDKPTNVLSWPSDELASAVDGGQPLRPRPGPEGMPQELGDIAIAWETCEREAADQGKEMRDHVRHLLVHGTLHLLGYDHLRDGDAQLMESTETRILAGLGVSDPYLEAGH